MDISWMLTAANSTLRRCCPTRLSTRMAYPPSQPKPRRAGAGLPPARVRSQLS